MKNNNKKYNKIIYEGLLTCFRKRLKGVAASSSSALSSHRNIITTITTGCTTGRVNSFSALMTELDSSSADTELDSSSDDLVNHHRRSNSCSRDNSTNNVNAKSNIINNFSNNKHYNTNNINHNTSYSTINNTLLNTRCNLCQSF